MTNDVDRVELTPDAASILAAAMIQAERDQADIANHRNRIQWLSQDRPEWSCGTPVDAHLKNALLIQSRDALARLGA